LYSFSTLLNTLNFSKIKIVDPHSNVALNLIKNSQAEYPILQLTEVIKKINPQIVCYPDKGAHEKYSKLYSDIIQCPVIVGNKIRDQSTGNILSYELNEIEFMSQINIENKTILIVDDICDYGNTFILLTKHLLNKKAKAVNLFVTHGLFSGGIKPLKESGINRIFCLEKEMN